MPTEKTRRLSPDRARRASSSRILACLPLGPTPRPNFDCEHAENYILRGSAETQITHHETLRLSIYYCPNEKRYIYIISSINHTNCHK